jgi:hypothetical protein
MIAININIRGVIMENNEKIEIITYNNHQIRKASFCRKCGSWYYPNELIPYIKNPNSFKCKYCKKGDWWDLWGGLYVDQNGNRMSYDEETNKWYTDMEWAIK